MPRAINSSSPVGSTLDLPGTVAPKGYLYCDGSAISRTTYTGLFSIIGIAHGSGDGSTTFNLPDYRGTFKRGVDNGAGRDPDTSSRTAMNSGGNTGDNVGSVQTSQYASHSHPYSGDTTGVIDGGLGSHNHSLPFQVRDLYTLTGSSDGIDDFASTYSSGGPSSIAHEHTFSGTTTAEGGNETRGINAYTNTFIRY